MTEKEKRRFNQMADADKKVSSYSRDILSNFEYSNKLLSDTFCRLIFPSIYVSITEI